MRSDFSGSTIWVTGAGGLIGNYVATVLSGLLPSARIVPLTRAHLDLLDFAKVEAEFRRQKPAMVIHCAAMSRGPDCEASPDLACKANVESTRQFCELTADAMFVFFSTDQVFDGRNAPYTEESVPHPLSVYAETKVEAEALVLACPNHLVIRTSLNGGTSPTGDRGFNEQLRRAWEAGREVTLFTDEFRCPIHAEDTARAVCELALRGCAGIYHVAGQERMSRWDLGVLVARRWPSLSPRIRPGSLAQYKGPPRAPDLTMDCSKAKAELERPIPGIAAWLDCHPDEEF